MKLLFRVFALAGIAMLVGACRNSAQNYVERGDRLFAQRKYDEASINYQNAIKKDAKSVEAYHKLGLSAFARGNSSVAIAAVTFAHQLDPSNISVSEDLADFSFQRYLTNGRTRALYDQTTQLIGEILEKNPNSLTGLRLRASVLYGDGKLKESIAVYRSINATHPFDPAIVLPLADALRLDGQDSEAEQLALALLSHKPDFPPIYDWLAQLYSGTGRPGETENILKKRIAQNPKDPSATIALARFYRAEHRDKDIHDLLESFLGRTDLADRFLVAGDFYSGIRNLAEAERCYRAGVSAQPSAKATYLTKLAMVYAALNRPADALNAVEEATQAEAFNAQAQSTRLAFLVGSNDPKDVARAVTLAQDLMKKWPKEGRYPAALAAAYRVQGNARLATTFDEQAARLDKDLVEPRIALAEASRQRRDTDGVFRYSEEALILNPRNVEARLLHAWAWMDRRDFESADSEMNALMQDAGSLVDVRFQTALLRIAEKKTSTAVELLTGLLKEHPGDERILAALATTYVQAKAYESAVRMVAAEVQKDPSSQPKRVLLANLAEKLGYLDIALQNFNLLSQNAPSSADYVFEIGKIYEAMGNPAGAISNFEKAVQLDPKDATKHGRLAMAYYGAGKLREADASSAESLKLDPADPVLLNNRAYILADTGMNPDEALRLIQTALFKNPDDPALSDTLAFCYIKKKLGDNALTILNRIVAAHPDEAMFRYHLAMALILKGDSAAAKRELQAGLARRPSKDDQAKIKELLSTIS